jgi:uncharacterized membrane protein
MNRSALEKLVHEWIGDGVISGEQGRIILERYPRRATGWLTAAYVLIGGVLAVAGVSLLIASNWQAIPALVKLAGVLALLVCGTVVGVEGRHRNWHRGIWECGFLVAAVGPLLGLMLVSQIFHLSGNVADLLAVWALAITPLALLGGSGATFLIWIVAGYFWLGFQMGESRFWRDLWQFFLMYAGAGAIVGAGSQLWLLAGRRELRTIGEFVGVATVGFSLWITGFDVSHWFALWSALFVAALGWIWMSMGRERVHQVNVGFVLVGLLIFSTFVRLVGTMAQTGVIFLSSGVVLLLTACGLEWLRRKLLRKMP